MKKLISLDEYRKKKEEKKKQDKKLDAIVTDYLDKDTVWECGVCGNASEFSLFINGNVMCDNCGEDLNLSIHECHDEEFLDLLTWEINDFMQNKNIWDWDDNEEDE